MACELRALAPCPGHPKIVPNQWFRYWPHDATPATCQFRRTAWRKTCNGIAMEMRIKRNSWGAEMTHSEAKTTHGKTKTDAKRPAPAMVPKLDVSSAADSQPDRHGDHAGASTGGCAPGFGGSHCEISRRAIRLFKRHDPYANLTLRPDELTGWSMSRAHTQCPRQTAVCTLLLTVARALCVWVVPQVADARRDLR